MQPVDLVALVSVIMGISIVLIPVIGLTARFALKPVVEALGRYAGMKGTEESLRIAERRLALIEQQIADMQSSLDRLVEVSEFDARLRAGEAHPALTRGAPPVPDGPAVTEATKGDD